MSHASRALGSPILFSMLCGWFSFENFNADVVCFEEGYQTQKFFHFPLTKKKTFFIRLAKSLFLTGSWKKKRFLFAENVLTCSIEISFSRLANFEIVFLRNFNFLPFSDESFPVQVNFGTYC